MQKQRPNDALSLPLMFVAADEENNKLIIESANNSSIVRLKFQKEMSIFREDDILPHFSRNVKIIPKELSILL